MLEPNSNIISLIFMLLNALVSKNRMLYLRASSSPCYLLTTRFDTLNSVFSSSTSNLFPAKIITIS